MRSTVILLALVFFVIAGIAPAQITLLNSATGGPPSATTIGTAHSLDSKVFKIGTASCYRSSLASGYSYLPTAAALDPLSSGMGGPGASPGFTIQWWYKPTTPTAFGYIWGDNPWSGSGGTFRCFQNGAAGVGNVTTRGPLTASTSAGAPLQNATDPQGWLHLACVVNTGNNTVTWYVNGVLNVTGPANITGKGGDFKCMGYDGSTSACEGNYDDIRIYNWARTAADVAADYTRNAIGTGPSGSPNVPDLGYYECELPTRLVASGSPRPGGTVAFDLTASGSANLPYQLGSSLGTGPTPIGNRSLDLSVDNLLVVTVGGYLPAIFANYAGTIDASGKASASVVIPAIPALIGIRIHTAFVTLSASSPFGIKAISSTESFAITN
jgi:concanavalin A-like lectin/glucanase superfamily protein